MTGPRDRHRERVHDERAGDRCPRCGRPFDEADRVDVHHHNENERDGHPANLRKRCKRCHLEGEHDRPEDADSKSPPGPSRRRPGGLSRSGPRR